MKKLTKEDSNKNLAWLDYRCPICNKLFFRGRVSSATIEIKCRCCKSIKVLEF